MDSVRLRPICHRAVRFALLVCCVWSAIPASASAQVYAWRDDAGNLVVSNAPKSGAAATFAVANAPATVRSTKPAIPSRARAYEALIVEHSALNGIRPELVRAVIQAESAFDPSARSHKGAMGLMQLMPGTASDLGVTDPYDPEQNIRGGTRYLRMLLDRYGEEELALAAYNAGPGAVEKYGAVPPYRETRNYVARIKTNAMRPGPVPVRPRLVRKVEIIDGREVTRLVTEGGTAAPSSTKHANNR